MGTRSSARRRSIAALDSRSFAGHEALIPAVDTQQARLFSETLTRVIPDRHQRQRRSPSWLSPERADGTEREKKSSSVPRRKCAAASPGGWSAARAGAVHSSGAGDQAKKEDALSLAFDFPNAIPAPRRRRIRPFAQSCPQGCLPAGSPRVADAGRNWPRPGRWHRSARRKTPHDCGRSPSARSAVRWKLPDESALFACLPSGKTKSRDKTAPVPTFPAFRILFDPEPNTMNRGGIRVMPLRAFPIHRDGARASLAA